MALETVSMTAQLLEAGMLAPERLTLLEGGARVPPQDVLAAGKLMTVRLLGNEFDSRTAVSAYAFELLKVMVSVEFPFCPTLTGENASATVGEFGVVTISVDEAVATLPPAGPVMRALAGTVLV